MLMVLSVGLFLFGCSAEPEKPILQTEQVGAPAESEGAGADLALPEEEAAEAGEEAEAEPAEEAEAEPAEQPELEPAEKAEAEPAEKAEAEPAEKPPAEKE